MSLPITHVNHVDRHLALSKIVASIAMREADLAHISSADGDNLQLAVSLADVTEAEPTGWHKMSGRSNDVLGGLLAVNSSVDQLVNTVSGIEGLLRGKSNNVIA